MENENQNTAEKKISAEIKTPKQVGVVETYAEDMTKAIQTSEGSLIKKAIQEEEEREEIKKNISPESSKNKIFMITGFFLIVASIVGVVLLFYFKNTISTVSVPSICTTAFLGILKTLSFLLVSITMSAVIPDLIPSG